MRGAVRVARLNCFDTANPHWSLPIPVSRCARQSRASHLIPAMSRKYPGSKLLIADTGGPCPILRSKRSLCPEQLSPGVGAAARRVTGSRVGGLCRVMPGYAGFKTCDRRTASALAPQGRRREPAVAPRRLFAAAVTVYRACPRCNAPWKATVSQCQRNSTGHCLPVSTSAGVASQARAQAMPAGRRPPRISRCRSVRTGRPRWLRQRRADRARPRSHTSADGSGDAAGEGPTSVGCRPATP